MIPSWGEITSWRAFKAFSAFASLPDADKALEIFPLLHQSERGNASISGRGFVKWQIVSSFPRCWAVNASRLRERKSFKKLSSDAIQTWRYCRWKFCHTWQNYWSKWYPKNHSWKVVIQFFLAVKQTISNSTIPFEEKKLVVYERNQYNIRILAIFDQIYIQIFPLLSFTDSHSAYIGMVHSNRLKNSPKCSWWSFISSVRSSSVYPGLLHK